MTLLRWLTFLFGSLTVTSTVLLFWICFYHLKIVFFSIAFLPLGNSDHFVVSVSIDFLSNSKQDAPFHRMAYDYSCADKDGLHDHLIDVPRKDFFKLGASATVSEFDEWVQVVTDVYIPHCKYKVKPHLPPWFCAVCAVAIVHKNHFFHLY